MTSDDQEIGNEKLHAIPALGDDDGFDDAAIREFVRVSTSGGVRSTGAKVVGWGGGYLYNVEGSDPDPKKVPKYKGKRWKPLLLKLGFKNSAHCYVGNPLSPTPSSHPGFDKGGHMTKNSKGYVAHGGSCYLMPICSWHNSKGRDRVKFTVPGPVKICVLSGYMLGETAATFMLRLPSEHPYALLFRDADGEWAHRDLSDDEAGVFLAATPDGGVEPYPDEYVVVERVQVEGDVLHHTRAHRLERP